jgi:hypothetical protein
MRIDTFAGITCADAANDGAKKINVRKNVWHGLESAIPNRFAHKFIRLTHNSRIAVGESPRSEKTESDK